MKDHSSGPITRSMHYETQVSQYQQRRNTTIHQLTKLIALSMQYFCFHCVPKLESAFRFGFDDCDDSVDCVDYESKGFIIRRVSM